MGASWPLTRVDPRRRRADQLNSRAGLCVCVCRTLNLKGRVALGGTIDERRNVITSRLPASFMKKRAGGRRKPAGRKPAPARPLSK